jgi:hypothetical protein
MINKRDIKVDKSWQKPIYTLALGIYCIGGAKAVVRIVLRGSLRGPGSEDE